MNYFGVRSIFFLVFIFGVVAYFLYSMTIGDTYGLLDKLNKIEGVESVSDYKTYEGRAFFTIGMSGGASIEIGGFGNSSFYDFNRINIEMVGSRVIMCIDEEQGLTSRGIKASAIQKEFLGG